MVPFLTWLIQSAAGPALVGLPVTWTATDLAKTAKGWFRRLRRSDGLSRIVIAATDGDTGLLDSEFAAIRRLLEQESTWVAVGRGTIEDLAALIATCLPDRSSESSLAAGRAIARALMEFAIRDLEPQWFKQVLFARLDRLEVNQASALDSAILDVHADLAALLARYDASDADRYAQVLGQLAQILDRLPPAQAGPCEVALYLATLIRWLSTDPWPQDVRFDGPELNPTSIERKLKVAKDPASGQQDPDADDLASRCARLIVLGGPGSGKTWLARRAVRLCAEKAIDALAAGHGVDQVELPLYTTCARLAAASTSDTVRRAVVTSALSQLPDLGGSRVTEALRALFEERNAPTLLVADSLDEARGADDRIRQADTLPATWRIILTGRPGSWNRQIAIRDNDRSRQVGYLRPLIYPEDVESFIYAWFRERPTQASNLAAQIRKRPDLQQGATVPLILAFYCLIGGDHPLPGRRTDLYAKVIRRMLTGRWRGSASSDPDPETCLETLHRWAWSAAESVPVSGIGIWQDEFLTPRVRQPRDDQDALDHVAVPTGPPDPDSGMRKRTFVHRSVHEHLVAEYVALNLSAQEAADELRNHLWYDPDWEYAGPAALAMHPQREQVLRTIISHATGGDLARTNLAAIDHCWQIRLFLTRVAQQSSEDSWSPDAAKLIGQARLDILTSKNGYLKNLHEIFTIDWTTSDGLIIAALEAQLAGRTNHARTIELIEVIAELRRADEDNDQLLRPVLDMISKEEDVSGFGGVYSEFRRLVSAVVFPGIFDERIEAELDPAQAQQRMLAMMRTDNWAAHMMPVMASELAVTEQSRLQARRVLLTLLSQEANASEAWALAIALARLDPTGADVARAREGLLALLGQQTQAPDARKLVDALAGLDPTGADKARARQVLLALLGQQTQAPDARKLVDAVARLDPVGEDVARARQVLLTLLSREADALKARELLDAVTGLDPTDQDLAQPRQVLLKMLSQQTRASEARELADAVARLDPVGEDVARARQVLLTLLSREADAEQARELVDALDGLDPVGEEVARARQVLLSLLSREADAEQARELADAVAKLDPTNEDLARARTILLGLFELLNDWADSSELQSLTKAVADLAPTAGDLAQARETLLVQLISQADLYRAVSIAEAVAMLKATPEDLAQAAHALLALVNNQTDPAMIRILINLIVDLSPTQADRVIVRELLFALPVSQSSHEAIYDTLGVAAKLAVTTGERVKIREHLLAELDNQNYYRSAQALAVIIAGLSVTPGEQSQACRALLALLEDQTNPEESRVLAIAISGLNPRREDLTQARRKISELLCGRVTAAAAHNLAQELTMLDPTREDVERALKALFDLLAKQPDSIRAPALVNAIASLGPKIADLEETGFWLFRSDPKLLAAVRRNSPLTEWISFLPKIRV